MEPSDMAQAGFVIDAAISIAITLDLPVDEAIVHHDSNKLALRLLPCDVFARVSPRGHEHARFEVGLAQRLAEAGCPVAALEARVASRGYQHDGFEVTFRSYYEPVSSEISPTAYAHAPDRLHAGMAAIDVPTPHFTDRAVEAEQLAARRDLTPDQRAQHRRGTAVHRSRDVRSRARRVRSRPRPRNGQPALPGRRPCAPRRLQATRPRDGRRVAMGSRGSVPERARFWPRAPESASSWPSMANHRRGVQPNRHSAPKRYVSRFVIR